MSIIIKGVKMPESCGTCFVGNRTICKNGCPLGTLPDKHGRLVDADALIIDLMDRGLEGIQTDDLAEIQQTVMGQPTIVEAEGEG